jgi:hypothetical protein
VQSRSSAHTRGPTLAPPYKLHTGRLTPTRFTPTRFTPTRFTLTHLTPTRFTRCASPAAPQHLRLHGAQPRSKQPCSPPRRSHQDLDAMGATA